MIYVKRDASGTIVAVDSEQAHAGGDQGERWQAVDADDPELLAFAAALAGPAVQAGRLVPHSGRAAAEDDPQEDMSTCVLGVNETDITMIRVIEDLIETLIDRGVIRFTDLPAAAQKKLTEKRSWRSAMRKPTLLDDDEHMI